MSGFAESFIAILPELVKAVFSQPVDRSGVQKVIIRPVKLRAERRYQAESFSGNKAFHRNLTEDELVSYLEDELIGRFRQILTVTETQSAQYCLKQNGSYKKTSASASVARPAGGDEHNRKKEYILSEGENIPALVDLGVFTRDMKVVRSKYDKYRQINRFIELVAQEYSRDCGNEISILDFGCGKSYLTFILYYYFAEKLGMKTHIIGYDIKADVVDSCNEIAKRYGYDGLHFETADVTKDKLADTHIDMVVTLHACDVATDYALAYAVKRRVRRIFSVPCCQHEVNMTIRRGGELDILMDYGIIKERMCALLTDSIRAAVLEDMGYSVDMIEFIDFEHSPKNIMIRAAYTGRRRSGSRIKAEALRDSYGFKQTLLELTQGGQGEGQDGNGICFPESN